MKEWKLLPWHSRQIRSDLGNRVPEQFLNPVLGQADHLYPGHPGQFPAHHLGVGQRVPGPPLLADGEVVKPFALVGVPQRAATLADRHQRPPLRAPVGAVIGPRRGADLPFLHLNRLSRDNTVVVLRKPIGLVAVEVDPFDAVGVATARRHHIHRRHRRLLGPLVAGPQSPTTRAATSDKPARTSTAGNWWISLPPDLPSVTECESPHKETVIILLTLLPFISYRCMTSNNIGSRGVCQPQTVWLPRGCEGSPGQRRRPRGCESPRGCEGAGSGTHPGLAPDAKQPSLQAMPSPALAGGIQT